MELLKIDFCIIGEKLRLKLTRKFEWIFLKVSWKTWMSFVSRRIAALRVWVNPDLMDFPLFQLGCYNFFNLIFFISFIFPKSQVSTFCVCNVLLLSAAKTNKNFSYLLKQLFESLVCVLVSCFLKKSLKKWEIELCLG